MSLRTDSIRNRLARNPISNSCNYFAALTRKSMGITFPTTGIPWLAANCSGLVSTQHFNKANSWTVDEASMLLKGGSEACARILLVMNKERGIGDGV